ncbi:MAG TPA: 50S ribosomal protein L22 [Candidatus Caldiarchaeum subterraneum]|uniref:Large ribosomal subunit protein uL22 n=1 Tax=Caldiarchaeum subterraneum TaxID=311458 RepID=A0A832ZWE1_CALS0|nr:50S ribosomal protein L22 [Aigarchaeota archaeon]HIQ30100.1 50S ribosomal protein L22 [Candidatus Caldarchaeum subterraneum]
MPEWGYSTPLARLDNAVKASVREVDVSPKWAREVCQAVKGLTIAEAKKLMEDVVAQRRMIPYRRYRKKRAHHAQTKGPGGYPVKVAKVMLKLLDSLEANAEFKGLDVDRVKIVHAAAHKGRVITKFIERAFGRSTPYNKTLVHIEVVGLQI